MVDAIERFSAGGAPRDDWPSLALQYRPAGVTVDAQSDEAWRFSVDSAPETALARGAPRHRGRSCGPATCRPRLLHDCVLALEELLDNVMTHAYGGQAGREAHVEVRMPPEEIRIRIEDAGPPFNPLEAPEPDLEAPVAERPIGELGLVLVKHLSDRWDYAREAAANVHTLYWRRPAETGEGASARARRSPDKEET